MSVIILWLILCIVVGSVAKSIGRSFFNYFILSFFLTPLIGFIVLGIKGRPREGEDTKKQKVIYYCPKCGRVYIANSNGNYDSKKSCSVCGTFLLETTVLASDWDLYPEDKKNDYKKQFSNGMFIKSKNNLSQPVVVTQSSGADEIKKYKELLDSGVITQEEFEKKKQQILGI